MRYRALRIVATVYRIIGWIVIVIGALGTCASSAVAVAGASYFSTVGQRFGYRAGPGFGVIEAIIILVIGLLYTGVIGVTLLAIAEGIHVFLDIEENTREIARRIRELPGVTPPTPGTPE